MTDEDTPVEARVKREHEEAGAAPDTSAEQAGEAAADAMEVAEQATDQEDADEAAEAAEEIVESEQEGGS